MDAPNPTRTEIDTDTDTDTEIDTDTDTKASANRTLSPEPLLGPGLVTALTVAFGLGILRAILPLLVFGIRDRFRWSALGAVGSLRLAGLVLLLFATAFLAGPMIRRFGPRRIFALGALGCGLGTVATQLWPGDPLGHLAILALGLVCLLLHLPAALVLDQGRGRGLDFAVAVCGGLLVDTAIHGAWRTFDPVWRHDLPSLGLVVAMVALQLAGLGGRARSTESSAGHAAGVGPRWLALGPWLFLELVLFGNLARLTALTGWSPSTAFQTLLLGRAITWLVVLGMAQRGLPGRGALLPAGAVLLVATALAWPVGAPAALLVVAGQVAGGLLLLALAGQAGPSEDGLGRPTTPRLAWHGGASLAFFFLLFLYYAAYDLPLPFENIDLLPAATLIVALAAIGRPRHRPVPPAALGPGRLTGVIFALLAAIVVLPWATGRPSEPPRATLSGASTRPAVASDGLRVMSYNIHCGFGPEGLLALERQARVIEAEAPDVVALQEVSRGWAINGSVDTLSWLARRLGMTAHFAPTADPLWGNAVLTRQPVVAEHRLALPAEGQRIRRGLLAVELAVETTEMTTEMTTGETVPGPEKGPVWILATHFHHRHRNSAIRQIQARAVLDFWHEQGRPSAILLGDLNAIPESPEIEILRRAGFRDVVSDAGLDPSPTFRSDDLERRLDYVLVQGPFVARRVVVPTHPASDHLAVAATLWPRP